MGKLWRRVTPVAGYVPLSGRAGTGCSLSTSRNNLHSLGSTQQRISTSSGELLHIRISFHKRRKQGTWDERTCNDFTESHPKIQAEKAGTRPMGCAVTHLHVLPEPCTEERNGSRSQILTAIRFAK